VAVWEPHLETINADLYRKDRAITWRHLANQTSSYGLAALPGTAFAYNDWQMALFWDILFYDIENHVLWAWSETKGYASRKFSA